jgi:hypothetical protein
MVQFALQSRLLCTNVQFSKEFYRWCPGARDFPVEFEILAPKVIEYARRKSNASVHAILSEFDSSSTTVGMHAVSSSSCIYMLSVECVCGQECVCRQRWNFGQTARPRNFIFVTEMDHDNQHWKGWVRGPPCPSPLGSHYPFEQLPDRSMQELHICHVDHDNQHRKGWGGSPHAPAALIP